MKYSEKYNGDDKNLAKTLREEKIMNTGLFEIIVGILATCHTQHT